jgi:hypothetical protein
MAALVSSSGSDSRQTDKGYASSAIQQINLNNLSISRNLRSSCDIALQTGCDVVPPPTDRTLNIHLSSITLLTHSKSGASWSLHHEVRCCFTLLAATSAFTAPSMTFAVGKKPAMVAQNRRYQGESSFAQAPLRPRAAAARYQAGCHQGGVEAPSPRRPLLLL